MTDAWIETFTGRQFDLLDPQSDQVCIEDIAHHLSIINRFTGASRVGVSVAWHSWVVAAGVPKVEALLHDAHEAYYGDTSSPLNAALGRYYAGLCDRCQAVIHAALGVPWPVPWQLVAWIKAVDTACLAAEHRDQFSTPSVAWPTLEGVVPLMQEFRQVPSASFAEQAFLARYRQLRSES